MINLFKHTARSYYDIYNPLVSAYPNKPTWLFKEMAGLFDFQSELMNRIATDILYPTTRESAYSFARLCDYDPVEADGATDTLTITLNSTMSKTLAKKYQVGGKSTSTGKMCIYELTADSVGVATGTMVAYAKQKKTYENKDLGAITSSDDFADYPIDGYINIIRDSMEIQIDEETWELVDNFDSSGATDKHFVLLYQSSGKVRFGFGDGVTGRKPTINSRAYGTFEVTEGSMGRMDAGDISINVGGDSDISAIVNVGSVGGNDSEGVSNIIRNARANVRLKDAVWSQEDLEIAARAASPDIAKALGVPALGSASVLVVPIGASTYSGGLPSTALKNAVAAYIQTLTQFGLMPITANNPNYTTINIVATTSVRTGYTAATVIKLVDFALTLISCPFDIEIIDYYNDNGIALCRTDKINVYWAGKYTFVAADEEALAFIIDKWVVLLGDREYREFGQDFEVGSAWVICESLLDYGADTVNIVTVNGAAPVNIAIAATYIANTGTITVTQV